VHNPKILLADTYYPDFISSVPLSGKPYSEELDGLLGRMFGTGDSYSYWLKQQGWRAMDVIANHTFLQYKYMDELSYTLGGEDPAILQIRDYRPDVLFLQDLSYFSPSQIQRIRSYGVKLIAAQCSCPWPGDEKIKMCDVIFTSFPHYVDLIKAQGPRAVYSRLAFDPRILGMLTQDTFVSQKIPITFVGGVGYPSHWKFGLDVLETIAKRVEEFRWFGYGQETLPDDMALKERYCHQAWGMDMYNIVSRSSIVVNRHGEVSRQYANNMKLYETTGCGALLLTDHKENLAEMFEVGKECVSYVNAEHAADLSRFFIEHPQEAQDIAHKGQERTLREHTYDKKMKLISDVLKEML